MNEYITNYLTDLAMMQTDMALATALIYASEEIASRDELLEGLQEFLRQNGLVGEYQASLNWDEREAYNEFFDLADEGALVEFLEDYEEDTEDDEYHW